MILTGQEILNNIRSGAIVISGFDAAHATTNSYDLHLGKTLLRYTSEILDPYVEPQYEVFTIPPEGHLLNKGDFVLGETVEEIGSDYFVPIIHGRSGVARLGLFAHVTADLIDIGSHGKSTLQLYATSPVRLYPGMPIAQVSFWKTCGEITLYNGKYQHSQGPMPSLSWKDAEQITSISKI